MDSIFLKRGKMMQQGLIIVMTGDGKEKTTAALWNIHLMAGARPKRELSIRSCTEPASQLIPDFPQKSLHRFKSTVSDLKINL